MRSSCYTRGARCLVVALPHVPDRYLATTDSKVQNGANLLYTHFGLVRGKLFVPTHGSVKWNDLHEMWKKLHTRFSCTLEPINHVNKVYLVILVMTQIRQLVRFKKCRFVVWLGSIFHGIVGLLIPLFSVPFGLVDGGGGGEWII